MVAFIQPKVSLDSTTGLGIRTLPELVDFHGENNPQHLFCLQVKRDNRFEPVSYGRLQHAIVRCQAWLEEQATGLHPPTVVTDGHVKKCAPVAILMESHVGLAVYVLACMGKGIPVVLLSARLSAPAVRHLIRKTGAKLTLVSPRLQPLASEAFPAAEGNGVTIRLVAGYEALLEEGEAADAGRPAACAAHPNHFVSEEDRQVLILHSSGTSGLPKPIPCSHRYFLGYATCHSFGSDKEAHGLTISTPPFFHGFGFVSICMSLGIGKTICIPPPSMIPNGASIAALIQDFGAKALLTVPSILEEIESLPRNKGHEILRRLDFVAFGGGVLKGSAGERLESAEVRLISQYGATETGPMTPFFVPAKGYNWRRLRLRSDILGPLQVKLDRVGMDINQPEHLQSDSERTYTYKLSMRPFGWQERFELQDLIVTGRECSLDSDIGQLDFSIAGRTDDLICLATGEKVRPTILESLLKQQEGVKDATAFGDQQFELGVIVESAKAIDHDEVESFKASIWPAIEEAGLQMDAHARIMSPAAILIVGPGALPRSDKGTILRNAVAKEFAEEMAGVYRNLEASVDAPPLDLSSPRSSIRALVAENAEWQAPDNDWLDDDDFFARGMDSLQATRLRRFLTASVRATHTVSGFEADHVLPVDKITDDFVYLHPSVSLLVEALMPKRAAANGIIPETDLIEQLVERYTGRGDHAQQQKGAVVVLTGATGSLGSFFLGRLLVDDSVSRIICLNRTGKENPIEAQKHALRSRDISVSDDMWAKVEIRRTSTAAPCLGLEEPEYERLASEVTHVVHIAWPMNFKMGLQSFDASFRSLQNLIQLARKAHFHHHRTKPRVLLISSISTVGNYPSVQGGVLIPEVIVEDPNWTLELGYAKAKLVCEKMIQRATNDYPEVEAGLIRVGQIAGARSGYWNASEHFVAVCASSQKMGKFPDLRGTLSWLPVDSAAKAIAEILFDHLPLQQVYHLENPVRQSWEEVAMLMSRELQIPSSSIIPLERWLDLAASAPGPDNPAASLIQFLRNDFLKMSCGSVVLDTSISRKIWDARGGGKTSDAEHMCEEFKKLVADQLADVYTPSPSPSPSNPPTPRSIEFDHPNIAEYFY
ncbi:hypothetical protein MMC22_009387 [Lobaria immixta]|nr:hypothetical protein [Lobaria immixta]